MSTSGFLPFLFLVVVLAAAGSSLAEDKARPNILWLVSEDNDVFLGCYGDPLARTPTLDKLAREGVVYERCFALQAANVLDRLAIIARPALPVLKQALQADAEWRGRPNSSQYPQRILERIIGVLEGQTPPLVYPAAGGQNPK